MISAWEFEQESRQIIYKILKCLQSKEQLKNTPQMQRAVQIEEEVYIRANKAHSCPESHNMWENPSCVETYKLFGAELVANMTKECGPYWRRVETGNISAKHAFDKFCKICPTSTTRKKEASTVLEPPVKKVSNIISTIARPNYIPPSSSYAISTPDSTMSNLPPSVSSIPVTTPVAVALTPQSTSSLTSSVLVKEKKEKKHKKEKKKKRKREKEESNSNNNAVIGVIPYTDFSASQTFTQMKSVISESCQNSEVKVQNRSLWSHLTTEKADVVTAVESTSELKTIVSESGISSEVKVQNRALWSNFTSGNGDLSDTSPAKANKTSTTKDSGSLWNAVQQSTKQKSQIAEQLAAEDNKRKEAVRQAEQTRQAEMERITLDALEKERSKRLELEAKEKEKKALIQQRRLEEKAKRQEMETTVDLNAQGIMMESFEKLISGQSNTF